MSPCQRSPEASTCRFYEVLDALSCGAGGFFDKSAKLSHFSELRRSLMFFRPVIGPKLVSVMNGARSWSLGPKVVSVQGRKWSQEAKIGVYFFFSGI